MPLIILWSVFFWGIYRCRPLPTGILRVLRIFARNYGPVKWNPKANDIGELNNNDGIITTDKQRNECRLKMSVIVIGSRHLPSKQKKNPKIETQSNPCQNKSEARAHARIISLKISDFSVAQNTRKSGNRKSQNKFAYDRNIPSNL